MKKCIKLGTTLILANLVVKQLEPIVDNVVIKIKSWACDQKKLHRVINLIDEEVLYEQERATSIIAQALTTMGERLNAVEDAIFEPSIECDGDTDKNSDNDNTSTTENATPENPNDNNRNNSKPI